MKKTYEDAVKALNGALLKKQASRENRVLAELLARPGAVYGAGLYAGAEPVAYNNMNAAQVMRGATLIPLAAELAGPIVAALTPTRTKEEQEAHDRGSAAADWLIPGVAAYNKWKRIGQLRTQEKTASGAQQVPPPEDVPAAKPSPAAPTPAPAAKPSPMVRNAISAIVGTGGHPSYANQMTPAMQQRQFEKQMQGAVPPAPRTISGLVADLNTIQAKPNNFAWRALLQPANPQAVRDALRTPGAALDTVGRLGSTMNYFFQNANRRVPVANK